jgi:hypothetical protein
MDIMKSFFLHEHCPRRLEDSNINTIAQKANCDNCQGISCKAVDKLFRAQSAVFKVSAWLSQAPVVLNSNPLIP